MFPIYVYIYRVYIVFEMESNWVWFLGRVVNGTVRVWACNEIVKYYVEVFAINSFIAGRV